ncbi:MAG: hypothetical protein ABFS12_15860 [Bacteroidota bacterium]
MKKSLKAILLFFAATVVLTSCSDDENPPTAGFSFSTTDAVQWDIVDVTSSAEKADDATCNVSGGAYKMEDKSNGKSIIFLEAATYTVTQTVTNGDGSDTMSQDITVSAPDNAFTMDGTKYEINTAPQWTKPSHGDGPNFIQFSISVSGDDFPTVVKLMPLLGADPLEGTYTYHSREDEENNPAPVRSYILRAVKNYENFMNLEWSSYGSGLYGESDLVVELVYDADNDVYDIKVDNYTIGVGNYVNWVFVEEAQIATSLYYRGAITPMAED